MRLLLDTHAFLWFLAGDARLRAGIQLLGIFRDHAIRVASLPWHHRDPFDRLLVAQAVGDGLTLLSRDAAFDDYGVSRVW